MRTFKNGGLNVSNIDEFKDLDNFEISEPDFVVGGAHVVDIVNENYLKVPRTQKCNCGLFEPNELCVNIDICDNCKWAQSPYPDSEILRCSKRQN